MVKLRDRVVPLAKSLVWLQSQFALSLASLGDSVTDSSNVFAPQGRLLNTKYVMVRAGGKFSILSQISGAIMLPHAARMFPCRVMHGRMVSWVC